MKALEAVRGGIDNAVQFLLHLVSDAAGRGEPKLVLGWAIAATGFWYFFLKLDYVGFIAIVSASATLLGLTALADHKIDMASVEVVEEPKEKRIGFDTSPEPQQPSEVVVADQ